MRFSVTTADETETSYDGVYVIEDGVLKIIPDDDNEPVIRLSPGFWQQIKEPRAPREPERFF